MKSNKQSIVIDYTKKELLEALEVALGAKIDDVTFWTWVKKGFVQPSSYVHRGSRLMPVFYKSDFVKLTGQILTLNESGKIRLKIK